MIVLPLSFRLEKYLVKRGLKTKHQKQVKLLSQNLRHPGLHVERLEPKSLGFYSFRLDRQFRVIFVYLPEENAIQIVDITDHYQK
ncbi:hypothetical protein COT44_04230 [Candidatus Shapirobacteria bacterium CG08_land_8_20_14_0_20_39_18]|uniref:Toxin YoeB n=1 Tax=Candidatus Shapirobacteria bacterium CG08_land_8_20_14_0_20_39_18 TaxID=1974883 RepID=A0A2M6XCB2_9BACT|nr:MAG: hypothetical protein COT44_04230 [Candidatus Shapirobacteria bacterium CG08_land_8_20_14_0_20_39_18]PIY66394.1 MAG: hypothetical protein COY91_00435 [Candidatus Shapirobacteria bacterium CG_4_10_14_0_8_um_filter_39_15]PJE68307.1 MAG: hypothetical protein COU94_02470 [Candidatus Shapirobacteria bacterium CG10_big_fil_rev_8_21_14_0_10_38_8]